MKSPQPLSGPGIIRLPLAAFFVFRIFFTHYAACAEENPLPTEPRFAGALIAIADASDQRLAELKSSGVGTVVLKLSSAEDAAKATVRAAAERAAAAGLSLAYWIEVARSPELADQHPRWMASLQTHDEWRRSFPDTPEPAANEVVKTYPWLPILSREPFNAQRERVTALLAKLPEANQIFLNDLQGAPSACGCGNPLCRWTSDYGKKRTTVPLGNDAAALFVAAIQKASPHSEVIPVWTTECEEHDGHPDGLCAGVACFTGICWKAYTRQLMPVAETSSHIGVLALYKQFQRDDAYYGDAEASWVRFALQSFQTMPPSNHGKPIPASRLIAVLQGWDVTPGEIAAQQAAARKAGAHGCIVAFDEIEQDWTPQIVQWK